VPQTARALLGKTLCRRRPDGSISRNMIRETEAYDGMGDKACHAHRGVTSRTSVMFGPPGHWYVYLCYGVHWMLNLVAREAGYPAAILIRGAGEVSGPGRLTKALAIDGSLNRAKQRRESGLWIEEGREITEEQVLRTPRIGIGYAGPEWSLKPYRFVIAPDPLGKRGKRGG